MNPNKTISFEEFERRAKDSNRTVEQLTEDWHAARFGLLKRYLAKEIGRDDLRLSVAEVDRIMDEAVSGTGETP